MDPRPISQHSGEFAESPSAFAWAIVAWPSCSDISADNCGDGYWRGLMPVQYWHPDLRAFSGTQRLWIAGAPSTGRLACRPQ